MSDWPSFSHEASRFYTDQLLRPRMLLDEFTATGPGSGRRPGPRVLLWQAVAVSAVAALEAGLEDLCFAAHAARLGLEGTAVQPGQNTPHGDPRRWLVEQRLMTPNAEKVEKVLFADFGLMLGTLPGTATFTVLGKDSPKGGSGRGAPRSGPSTWTELRRYLETLAHIRNATAHADARKLGAHPQHCHGALWLQRADGSWSVQQPHGLTALRAVLAIYNTVADGLCSWLAISPRPSLTAPDTIVFPANPRRRSRT